MTADAGMTLSDTGLRVAGFGTAGLSHIPTVALTGGTSANTFTLLD